MAGEYKQVRSLERGLQVLEVLNEYNGAEPAVIAKTTGLPRATVHRILETLKAGGYIAGGSTDERYHLTMKVRALSEGFADDSWISSVVPDVLSDLNKLVPWPCDFATVDTDAMVVRESSARWSKFSLHRSVIGRRIPLLSTALGRAYLSFCGDEERYILIRTLERSASRATSWLLQLLPQTIQETRAAGYATNAGEEDRRFSAFAVPVFRGDRATACLNVRFFSCAMTVEDAVKRYLPTVKNAVAAMQLRMLDYDDPHRRIDVSKAPRKRQSRSR